MKLECPECHSDKAQRRGMRKFKFRYQCKNCGTFYSVSTKEVSRTAKVLVFDIETLPMVLYAWDLWYPIRSHKNIIRDSCTLSWAAKWLFDDKIHSAILTPKEAVERNDKRIMEELWKLLDEADIVIGHNAKSFDVKKVNTRFLYYGMKPPSNYLVIDTKNAAKSMFSLPSNSQAYITKFLEAKEKMDTDFELWKKCDAGDVKALKYMLEYNIGDIAGLEEMYVILRPWIPQHPNMAVYMTTDDMVCPKCGTKNIQLKGLYSTPANAYRAFRCGSCGTIGRTSNTALTTTKRKNMVRSY